MSPTPEIAAVAAELVHVHDRPRGELARAVRSGTAVRVARGRYSPAADPAAPAWQQVLRTEWHRALAVGQNLAPGLAVTGLHAAILHGAPLLGARGTVHVLGPGKMSTTRSATFFRRHHRKLTAEDVTTAFGARITTIARTMVECGRLLPLGDALPVVDGLLRVGARVSRWHPEESAERNHALLGTARRILDAEPRLRGNPTARLVLDTCDGRAETVIESQARRITYVLGFPRAHLQVHYVIDGERYFPDLTWYIEVAGSIHVIHLECDGLAKYEDGASLESERDRQTALESLGHIVLRLTRPQIQRDGIANLWRQVRRKLPAEVIAVLEPRPLLATPAELAWLRHHRPART